MREKVLNKIIERASSIWKTEPSAMSEETVFADMNPKSAHYSQMTTFLEDEFDIEVPYMNFKRCRTFGEAADYIVELLED
ncbi:acyl carrier protein [Lacrimispora defluvii]|uniref:Acyl carrier protein n=1 Tax=Lacrimispora defluvii TaxID=2719233 RepID=A0ABX1VVW1_9FIRM|nr:acyl carrier protein [Lacrimispora defluvii]NNJ31909.1 acyl carrier protein [Lacrimispora defluvii]